MDSSGPWADHWAPPGPALCGNLRPRAGRGRARRGRQGGGEGRGRAGEEREKAEEGGPGGGSGPGGGAGRPGQLQEPLPPGNLPLPPPEATGAQAAAMDSGSETHELNGTAEGAESAAEEQVRAGPGGAGRGDPAPRPSRRVLPEAGRDGHSAGCGGGRCCWILAGFLARLPRSPRRSCGEATARVRVPGQGRAEHPRPLLAPTAVTCHQGPSGLFLAPTAVTCHQGPPGPSSPGARPQLATPAGLCPPSWLGRGHPREISNYKTRKNYWSGCACMVNFHAVIKIKTRIHSFFILYIVKTRPDIPTGKCSFAFCLSIKDICRTCHLSEENRRVKECLLSCFGKD